MLLKLLLATVSASTSMQAPQSSTSSVFPPGVASRMFLSVDILSVLIASIFIAHDQPPAPPPTLDEIDVTRHREITSKAVSAILLLVLKWFKVSREFRPLPPNVPLWIQLTDVMKFHHLGQHLLDTNCLLLILKMFGLQEVSASVVSKADSPENK